MIRVFSTNVLKEFSEDILSRIRKNIHVGWLGASDGYFKEMFARYLGVPNGRLVAVNSCTDGIFIAMKLLNLHGGEVIMPTIHFHAAGQAVVAAGGTPVLCDTMPGIPNLCVKDLEKKVNEKTRAVFGLHWGGFPFDVAAVRQIVGKNVVIIEDAATALLSSVKGKQCGTLGDIGLWSFDPVKQISTPCGGMMYFKDEDMARNAERMARLATEDASGLESSKKNDRWWEMNVATIGMNSPFNSISEDFAAKQLLEMDLYKEKVEEVLLDYRRAFSGLFESMGCRFFIDHVTHDVTQFFLPITTQRRDYLAQELLNKHYIYTTFRYWPLHRQDLTLGENEDFPNAEETSRTMLLLPFHARMTAKDVLAVKDGLYHVLMR